METGQLIGMAVRGKSKSLPTDPTTPGWWMPKGSAWGCEQGGTRCSPATVWISFSSSFFLWKWEPV